MIARMNSTVASARPDLAFRVGVTGARAPAAAIDALRPCVETVLRQIQEELDHLAARADVKAAYAPAAPRLTVISPLAEGADRLVARVGVDLGYRLHVPTPFPKGVYRDDFTATPGSVDAFNTLLGDANAGVLQLDGARDDPVRRLWHQCRSYEAVGRYVVHNCDLLIAIWDGTPAKGRGGTAEIVRRALDIGVPIWWIDATDPTATPIWLEDVAEPRIDQKGRPACAALTDFISQLIVPPKAPDPHPHGVIEALIRLVPGDQRPPHLRYLANEQLESPWWCGAHAWLLRMTAAFRPRASEPATPSHPIAIYWHEFYRQADALSRQVGDRYRSTYVWVFALIALSLVLAAFGAAFVAVPDLVVLAHLAALPEAVALALIFVLIACNIRCDWHQRWIDARLLSELLRKQQALAVIGWSLPGRAVSRLAEQQSAPHERDRAAWVPWFFAAVLRAAPLAVGVMSAETLREPLRMAREDLVEAQRRYHADRRKQYRRAARTLIVAGELLFLVVAYLVYLKVCHALVHPDAGVTTGSAVIEFLAVALPTIGAASLGIRAYAELQLLAEQSRHMERIMGQAEARLKRLEGHLGEPLASQDLGAVVNAVTMTMLQEVDGWARMFRVKVIEAG